MDYRKLFKEINKGDWQGIYLFFGEEQYIKQQALNRIIEAMVDPSLKDLNYAQIDGTDVDLDIIINACETLPFMVDRRLVVVKDLSILNGRADGNIDEDSFLEYIKKMSETTCLILYCRNGVDKRKKIYKYINKTGKAIEFKYLTGKELHTWINQTVEQQGKKISYKAISYLVDRVGNELNDISNELKKLISYIGQSGEIDIKAIDQVVTPTLEQSIFQLVDAIGEKRSSQALMILGNLINEGGQAAPPILAMIARQFRLILQCKEYREKGYNPNTIAAKLNQRSFVVKKCLSQARNFTVEQLKKGLELCLQADYYIKIGKIQDSMALELIIIKMCNY
ncbi:MAG: DNA polymerase III subunit delta [Clostridiales bacterium]|nr:DNA polymerase III subunit delta [Clostridiales bacterium]